MKKKIIIIASIVVGVLLLAILSLFIYYNNNMKAMDSSDITIIEVEIPKGSTQQIGKVLEENNLIRSSTFFNIYVKLFKPDEMKYGVHSFSRSMTFKEILEELAKEPRSKDEISLTFKEGITMRKIATVISEKTNNSYESVLEKANDMEYIEKLIDKYWFITDEIKNDNLKYKLEGYLFPNTYRYKNKDVSVEEIFNKMLDEMNKVLEPMKEDIEKSGFSIHQILTLASLVEKESTNNDEYRKNVASVFLNRLEQNWHLGSDVTTYYALDIDNALEYVRETCGGRNCIDYGVNSPYNTRLGDGSMNGKLPVGPISTISLSSLKASVYPKETDYLYFLSNIKTFEMFFFSNTKDFESKKAELAKDNEGI